MRVRRSKRGMIVAILFLLLAGIAFATHLYSVKTNAGDSGESAVWFFLFTLPWGVLPAFMPDNLVYSSTWGKLAYPISWSMVLLNSFLIYCAAGGLRFSRGRNS